MSGVFMGYKTKQGERIFELLIRNEERHLTAEEICGLLKTEGAAVGTATVYRNLEKLVSEGKVKRYRLEEGVYGTDTLTPLTGCTRMLMLLLRRLFRNTTSPISGSINIFPT